MSKAEQITSSKFIEEYLRKRPNISLIVLLLDIRHKPTADDRLMVDFLMQNNLQFMMVANKADKLAPTKVDAYIQDIKKELDTAVPVLPFSSEKKIYMQDVLDEMFKE